VVQEVAEPLVNVPEDGRLKRPCSSSIKRNQTGLPFFVGGHWRSWAAVLVIASVLLLAVRGYRPCEASSCLRHCGGYGEDERNKRFFREAV